MTDEMEERVARAIYEDRRTKILNRIALGAVSASMSGIEYYPEWPEAGQLKGQFLQDAKVAIAAMRADPIPILASRNATNDVLDLAIKPDATGKFEGDSEK